MSQNKAAPLIVSPGGRTHTFFWRLVNRSALAGSACAILIFRLSLAADPSSGSNYALSLNGLSDAYVFVGHDETLNCFPLTVEVWVKTTDTIGLGLVTKYFDTSNNGWSLHLVDGRVRFWYFKDIGNHLNHGERGLDGGYLADGQWHHISVVVDGSGARIYIDAKLTASRNWTGTPGPATSSQALLIGRYPNHSLALNAEIDEVRVWNVSRTEAEISANMHRTFPGSVPGLVAYYTFNEGAGTLTRDASGNGNTGMLSASARWVKSQAPRASPASTATE